MVHTHEYDCCTMIAHYYLVDSHLAFIEPVILTVGMTELADAHQLIQLAWCHPRASDTKYVLSLPFATHRCKRYPIASKTYQALNFLKCKPIH